MNLDLWLRSKSSRIDPRVPEVKPNFIEERRKSSEGKSLRSNLVFFLWKCCCEYCASVGGLSRELICRLSVPFFLSSSDLCCLRATIDLLGMNTELKLLEVPGSSRYWSLMGTS